MSSRYQKFIEKLSGAPKHPLLHFPQDINLSIHHPLFICSDTGTLSRIHKNTIKTMLACTHAVTNCYHLPRRKTFKGSTLNCVFNSILYWLYYLASIPVCMAAYGDIIPTVHYGSCWAWRLDPDSSQLTSVRRRLLKKKYMFHFYQHPTFPLLIKYKKRAKKGWGSW